MAYAKTEVLVAEQQIVDAATDGAVSLAQPANFTDAGSWADEATFTLSVVGVRGAPATWSLGVKFQFLQPHAGVNKFQYQQRRWFDLQPDQVETCVIEGVGWYSGNHALPVAGEFGIVADQTDSLATPITIQRTVKHFGSDVRIVLDPKFTGGTTPSLSIALTRTPKATS